MSTLVLGSKSSWNAVSTAHPVLESVRNNAYSSWKRDWLLDAYTGAIRSAPLVPALADTMRPTKLRMQGTSSDFRSDGAAKFTTKR